MVKTTEISNLKLKLIYFEGCPNVEKARKALMSSGLDFEEINQDHLPPQHPLKNYSSPTILRHKEIIFGAVSGPEGGCLLEIPTGDQLRTKLLKILN